MALIERIAQAQSLHLYGPILSAGNEFLLDRVAQPTPLRRVFYSGGTIMILFYLVCVYRSIFLNRWESARKTKRTPNRTAEPNLTSPLNSPELLKLKNDLW